MASVSLYVGIRSKVGQSHEMNKTNIYIDGKAQDSARMTAGYENQFSCRKGCFGIAEGNEDGVRGSESAKALLEALGAHASSGAGQKAEEALKQFLSAAEKTGETRLALIHVQDGELCLSGFGGMPAFLLRGHRMRSLPASEPASSIIMETLALENKDRLLLCTRELQEYVEPAMLQTILDGREEPNQIAGELIAEAIKNGAKRDVTAIVVACETVESLTTEPLLDVDAPPEDETPEELAGGAPWYRNKKLVGTVSVVGICVLAVAGVTLASVLSKKNAQPVAGNETQSRTMVSEPLATLTQPSTTQPGTTEEAQTDEVDTTRETTQRRTTTTTKKTTTKPTSGSDKTSHEDSTQTTHREETIPSTTNDE